MSEYSHLSEPDEELVPYMEALKALPQIYDVAARRAMMAVWVSDLKKSQASGLPPGTFFDSTIYSLSTDRHEPDTRYRVTDHQVDVAGGTILVRGLIPTSDGAPDQIFPLMFWMHVGLPAFSRFLHFIVLLRVEGGPWGVLKWKIIN
jgi:hypothetical protein